MTCEVFAVAALALSLSALLPSDEETAKKYLFPVSLFNQYADPIRRKFLSMFLDNIPLNDLTVDIMPALAGTVKGEAYINFTNGEVHNIGSTLRQVGEYDFNRKDEGFLFELKIEAFNISVKAVGNMFVVGALVDGELVASASHMVSKIEAYYAKGALFPVFKTFESTTLDNFQANFNSKSPLLEEMIAILNKDVSNLVLIAFDGIMKEKLSETFGETWWGAILRNACKTLSGPVDMLMRYVRSQSCTGAKFFEGIPHQRLDYTDLSSNEETKVTPGSEAKPSRRQTDCKDDADCEFVFGPLKQRSKVLKLKDYSESFTTDYNYDYNYNYDNNYNYDYK